MPPETALKPETLVTGDTAVPQDNSDSLFERFDWLYILCREKIFRDDTDRMVAALWPNGQPPAGSRLVELGCGPGFYSRQLARRFPQLDVLGIDRSRRQLSYARDKAQALGLKNCRFDRTDVLDVTRGDSTFDVIIASRLFTVLPERERAVAEMHRVLRIGGRCFIAEPRYAFWASIPLFMMWVLATVTGHAHEYCEPRTATVFSPAEFERLFRGHAWRDVRIWQDGRYQYALCEKG